MARCRALVLLMLLAVSSIAALGLAAPLLRPDRLTVTTGLTASLAWALVGCGGWVALTAALLAIETAATGRATRTVRLAPRLARTVAATACGVSLTVAVAGSGSAEPLHSSPGSGPVHVLDGLELPERVADPPHRRRASPLTVTVRAGDTLWELAREHDLPWPRLYRANRAAVGADPDLIQPGLHLTIPANPSEARTPAPHSPGADPR